MLSLPLLLAACGVYHTTQNTATDGPHSGDALLTAADGGTTPDAASTTGSATVENDRIGGQDFTPRSAFFLDFPANNTSVMVVISDHPDLCGRLLASPAALKNVKILTIGLQNTDGMGQTSPLSPGIYRHRTEVPSLAGRLYSASFSRSDAVCKVLSLGEGMGTVNLDTYSLDVSIEGHYDLSFLGETGRGTFKALHCPYEGGFSFSTACE